MKNIRTLRGIVFALLAGVCWGLSGTVSQFLFTRKEMDAGLLTVIRMLGAGTVLLGLCAVRRDRAVLEIWKQKRHAVRLVLFGLCGLMAVQYTYMATISHSNSGTATALQYLGQAMILLVVCIADRRKPTRSEGLGLLFATAGAFFLATHGRLDSIALSPQALFWGLTSAATVVIYTLSPGDLMDRYGSCVVSGYGMLLGGIVLFFLLRAWRAEFVPDAGALVAICVVVLVGTALAFTMYLQAVADIGGVKTGLLSCTEMLSAPLIAHFWLGTEFAPADLIGFVLMIVMVFMLASPAKEKKSESVQ